VRQRGELGKMAGLIEIVKRSVALAMILEPTGWGITGNVSRSRDHPDKTIQDYIVLGYDFAEKLVEEAAKEDGSGYALYYLIKEHMNKFGTNLALGEIFLLYLNVYGSIKMGSLNPDRAAEGGSSLVYKMWAESYINSMRLCNLTFIGRFSFSGMPSLTPMIGSKSIKMRLVDLLQLNIFDPVSYEAAKGFPYTRSVAAELKGKLQCGIPKSEDIDFIFRELCCRYNDFLVYRKNGLDASEIARLKCCAGKKISESLGSISDLVALVLFYYFLSCEEREEGYDEENSERL